MDVCFRHRNWLYCIVCAVMFVPFAAFASYALAQFVQRPHWFVVVISLPFSVAAFLLGLTAIYYFASEERLRIDREGCVYRWSMIVCWRSRRVPLCEVKTAVVDRSRWDREPTLLVRTLGEPLRFGSGADPEALNALRQTVNSCLHVLGAGSGANNPGEAAALPVESTIRWESTMDGLRLRRRGKWCGPRLFEMTIATLFVGGIVGSAAGVITNKGHFGELILLTPFVLLAALPAIGWLKAILAPAFTSTWHIRRDELTICRRFLGLGFPRTVSMRPLKGVRVTRYSTRWRTLLEKVRFDGGSSFFVTTDEGNYTLAFIDARRQQAARINGLTEGEARWLRDLLQRDFGHWFTPIR